MAKNEISDYDETNANNTDISGIAVSNSSLIAQIDDIVRAQMGALKRWFRSDLFRLRDSTDQTKLLAFGLSGQSTGVTRTLKTQDFNGSIDTQAKWTDIASASTTNLATANGSFGDVTGTTTITALGTADAGIERLVRFTGTLTLTYNATSLILPGAVNKVTAAGDVARFISLGSGNWLCADYQPAGGIALAAANQTLMEAAASNAAAVTPGTMQYHPAMPKALIRLSSLTLATPVATNTFSAVGTITCSRTGTGVYVLSWPTSMNGISCFALVVNSTNGRMVTCTVLSGATLTLSVVTDGGSATDPDGFVNVQIFGDI